MKSITTDELKQTFKSKPVQIVDVRTEERNSNGIYSY